MRKGGIHIIDTNDVFTLEKIKKVLGLHKNIDSIAIKYIENYNKLNILFSNSMEEAPENIRADAYHYAKLELDSVQILHQENSCWSIFNREERNTFKKAEQISKKLLLYYKCSGIRTFTIDGSDALFAAQGYIDGTLFFDFQIGSFLDHIGFCSPFLQRKYLKSRNFEKSDPHLIESFFQTDCSDLVNKIYCETNPEKLVALFEEMLSMQLFFNYSY